MSTYLPTCLPHPLLLPCFLPVIFCVWVFKRSESSIEGFWHVSLFLWIEDYWTKDPVKSPFHVNTKYVSEIRKDNFQNCKCLQRGIINVSNVDWGQRMIVLLSLTLWSLQRMFWWWPCYSVYRYWIILLYTWTTTATAKKVPNPSEWQKQNEQWKNLATWWYWSCDMEQLQLKNSVVGN